MTCENCLNEVAEVRASIIGDFYYRHICANCYQKLTRYQTVSSGEAEYNRGRDAEEHEADGRQPYTDGKPDAEFIKLYPATARKMFTDEQIDQATRH